MNEGKHYHLVGVAGVGMSALAQAMLARGYVVSGSDRYRDKGENLEVLGKLELAGVRLSAQDGTAITAQTSGIVISTAIESDNPDMLAAKRLNIPVIHRAEMLASLVEGKKCVAVTGTSGKSTTTGMIGWVLEQLGADPTVVNGAPVLNWCNGKTIGNTRIGKSDLWVIEADESDRSLMRYKPDWAVITNVSKDHFEIEETKELFKKFSAQVTIGIVNGDDLTKGFRPEMSAAGSSFRCGNVAFQINLPGRHNAENALCAAVLCERLGFNLGKVAGALASFRGIQRRLELVGTAKGVTVIDDYGHNPMKIRAAFEAVSPYCKRVIAVWRPHGFKPLSLMMNELVGVLAEVCRPSDRLYVLPVYDVGGTADRSVNSDVLVEKLRALGVPAEFVQNADTLAETIVKAVKPGDVVLTMGARDPGITLLARSICHSLERRKQRWE